jgi:iron complex transport system ATP-binding protein
MIALKNVAKTLASQEILSDINLSLEKGQMTAFIGPNGAGKSTLLAMIARLLPRETGEIYLEGQEIKSWQTGELAKKLGILKQMNHITLSITVRELVAFGRFPYSHGHLTKADHQLIDEALLSMGLEDLASSAITRLSGGQLQRAYIAMILAQDTDYILLDEPLNNLDMNYAQKLMMDLQALVETKGKTVIIVLHDINFAASYANHIVAMKHAKIFANGATDTIIQEHLLKQLFDMSIRICQIDNKKICMYF